MMFCFVDFRNRPQYQHTFSSRQEAREYLRKIQNNPLGATVIHANGRREYFESDLPKDISKKNIWIKRGCHVKYKIRPLVILDGVAPAQPKRNNPSLLNWKIRQASPLFMLGNLKFSACLLIVALTALSFSYIFQKNLGQSAIAYEAGSPSDGIILGASHEKNDDTSSVISDDEDKSIQLADEEVIINLIGKIDEKKHENFEKELMQYIKGHPMEAMAPYIAKQPRIVAAFLVGIAMKESKFGTYAPRLDGRDCRNYWGFKGGGVTASGGYTCFDSPEQAIEVVGRRIAKLVDGGRTNPSEMVIWKCGSTCSWDNPENVRKWIADVGINFYRINSKQNS